MLRFLDPEEGELLLDGQPYRSLSHGEVRARLAYVEQETPVVPGTIRENLLFTQPDATEEDLRGVLRAVRLDEKVALLDAGLDAPLTPSSKSGGSASGSAWPVRCCAAPTCCCSTRRPRRWTG